MKIFSWLSCILAAVITFAAKDVQATEPPKELIIETTYKPDSCPYQSKKKDYIHVHYVSRWRTAILVELDLD
jgi:hypothetical protein